MYVIMTPEEMAAQEAMAMEAPMPEQEAADPVENAIVGILDLWSTLPQEASIELLAMLNAQFNSEMQAAQQEQAPQAAEQRAAMMADEVF